MQDADVLWCNGNETFAPPEDEIEIGDGRYCNCATVKSIQILYATKIGVQCFLNLPICESVFIGDSVRDIGWHAFEIPRTAKIKIGKNLRTVGSYCMRGCQLTIDSENPYLKMNDNCHGLYYIQTGDLV